MKLSCIKINVSHIQASPSVVFSSIKMMQVDNLACEEILFSKGTIIHVCCWHQGLSTCTSVRIFTCLIKHSHPNRGT